MTENASTDAMNKSNQWSKKMSVAMSVQKPTSCMICLTDTCTNDTDNVRLLGKISGNYFPDDIRSIESKSD